MRALHVFRHTIESAEQIAEVGLISAIVLVSGITAAILIFSWFYA
jgi:hypothetical protein